MKFDYITHPKFLEVVCEGEFDLADSKASIDNVYRLCDTTDSEAAALTYLKIS